MRATADEVTVLPTSTSAHQPGFWSASLGGQALDFVAIVPQPDRLLLASENSERKSDRHAAGAACTNTGACHAKFKTARKCKDAGKALILSDGSLDLEIEWHERDVRAFNISCSHCRHAQGLDAW